MLSKRFQDASKPLPTRLEAVRNSTRWSKKPQRYAKNSPRCFQATPRRAQNTPATSPRRSKTTPRQHEQEPLQEFRKTILHYNRLTNVFKNPHCSSRQSQILSYKSFGNWEEPSHQPPVKNNSQKIQYSFNRTLKVIRRLYSNLCSKYCQFEP